jgi:hypothetical protein
MYEYMLRVCMYCICVVGLHVYVCMYVCVLACAYIDMCDYGYSFEVYLFC